MIEGRRPGTVSTLVVRSPCITWAGSSGCTTAARSRARQSSTWGRVAECLVPGDAVSDGPCVGARVEETWSWQRRSGVVKRPARGDDCTPVRCAFLGRRSRRHSEGAPVLSRRRRGCGPQGSSSVEPDREGRRDLRAGRRLQPAGPRTVLCGPSTAGSPDVWLSALGRVRSDRTSGGLVMGRRARSRCSPSGGVR